MNSPDISVVVPVYNSEEEIAACIESILAQTAVQLELIIVDDGSTDGSGAICDRYAGRDRRVTVVHQINKGRTEARFVGTRQAQGEWVCYVDSDDTLPPDALELLFGRTGDGVDIVLGNGHELPDERRESIPMAEFRHLAVRAEGTIGVPWGSLYRRQLLSSWLFDLPRHIYNGEDYLFWLRLVFSTDRPVSVVYESVYNKGTEHTSNSFVWTASYCHELNELRKASIPAEMYMEFLPDMLEDRLANLYAVACSAKRGDWVKSDYYRDIMADLQTTGRRLSWKNWLFLTLPSRWLRRMYSTISQRI